MGADEASNLTSPHCSLSLLGSRDSMHPRAAITVFSVLALLCVANANLYDSNPEVVDLTSSNFQSKVMNSEEVWLVEFYAPWCGHCKALAPDWVKAAKALKRVVMLPPSLRQAYRQQAKWSRQDSAVVVVAMAA